MTIDQFIQEAKRIQSQPSVYAYGFTGQTLTGKNIKSKAKQYPSWYSQDRINRLYKSIGINGYDCSGLIKAIFKNMNETIPDLNADMIFKMYCEPAAEPKKGMLIHKSGHIGILIDSDYVIEASSSKGSVIISKRSEKLWTEFGTFKLLNQESNGSNNENLLEDLKALIKKYGG